MPNRTCVYLLDDFKTIGWLQPTEYMFNIFFWKIFEFRVSYVVEKLTSMKLAIAREPQND